MNDKLALTESKSELRRRARVARRINSDGTMEVQIGAARTDNAATLTVAATTTTTTKPVKSSSSHTMRLVFQSLLIFIALQASNQIIKHSEASALAATSLKPRPRGPQSAPLLDALILDTDSLYQSTNSNARRKRSASATSQPAASKFVDACQSKMEVLTPYYATNSKGKLRTIVNSELMQQAIQVETCLRPIQSTSGQANRCNAQPECGCEQKYKWHRLLVLDPNESQGASKGLFMDWFLFPSNCVCRCKPGASVKHFVRTISGTRRQHNQSSE